MDNENPLFEIVGFVLLKFDVKLGELDFFHTHYFLQRWIYEV